MPYIEQEDRTQVLQGTINSTKVAFTRQDLGILIGEAMRNGGDLQYMLAVAIQTYLESVGLNYQHCQDIMGALTGANAEFYKKIVGPYEDQKIIENGGVYNIDDLMTRDY